MVCACKHKQQSGHGQPSELQQGLHQLDVLRVKWQGTELALATLPNDVGAHGFEIGPRIAVLALGPATVQLGDGLAVTDRLPAHGQFWLGGELRVRVRRACGIACAGGGVLEQAGLKRGRAARLARGDEVVLAVCMLQAAHQACRQQAGRRRRSSLRARLLVLSQGCGGTNAGR